MKFTIEGLERIIANTKEDTTRLLAASLVDELRKKNNICECAEFSFEELVDFIARVEEKLGLPAGIMNRKHKHSNRPYRVYGEFDLSELRKVIIIYIKECGYAPVKRIGRALGVDYSTICQLRKRASYLQDTQDEKFSVYYQAVSSIPVITTEKQTLAPVLCL
jgi:hypothetical protein